MHLIVLIRRGGQNLSELGHSIALPLASVLLPAVIWMGYYNHRVTGDALQMPYSAVDQQYGSWSPFLWSNHPRPEPKFNHGIFRALFLQFENPVNQFQRQHILFTHLINLIGLYRFFLGLPLLLVILVSSIRLMRNRRLRLPLLLLPLFYLGLSVEVNLYPHYFAPATVLVFLIASAAVQDVSSRFSRGKIRLIAVCTIFYCVAIFEVSRIMDPASRFWRLDMRAFIAERDRVLTTLQKQPGQLLVLVRYGPNHLVHFEWVYNDANIDQFSHRVGACDARR